MADESLSLEYLDTLADTVRAELGAVADDAAAEAFRIKYLGKKGQVRSVLKGLKDVPAEQRRDIGAAQREHP